MFKLPEVILTNSNKRDLKDIDIDDYIFISNKNYPHLLELVKIYKKAFELNTANLSYSLKRYEDSNFRFFIKTDLDDDLAFNIWYEALNRASIYSVENQLDFSLISIIDY